MNNLTRYLSTLLLLVASFTVVLNASAQADVAETPQKRFAVRFTTGPNWDHARPFNEQQHAREHSANLGKLRREGKIIVGARFGEVGLIVLSAGTEDEARAMIEQDPAVKAGIFNYQLDAFAVFYGGELKTD